MKPMVGPLLRAGHERPRRRAAEQRDELAPPHRLYPKAKDHELGIAGPGQSVWVGNFHGSPPTATFPAMQ
jgi:hypothetical protein